MSDDNMNVTDITSAIKGITFPCSKEDLVNQAEENNAPQDVINLINNLDQESYESLTEVTQSFSKES
jgi:hypothetical protein